MPSHPRLNSLPVEVMEIIVTLLEFRDICNLRLTAAEVAAKSSQGRFRKHFHTQTIKLTAPEQLDDFVHMTRPQQLGCLVQHLTLVTGLPTPPLPDQEESSSEQEHGPAGPLGQAMKNLRLNSARGAVRSISLAVEGAEIRGSGERPWRSVWAAAAECFETTALALGASSLRVEEVFDIFGRLPRCSLACDLLARVLEQVDLYASLQGVKQLSLSLSHHRMPKRELESEDMRSLAYGERNTHAIVGVLRLCSGLEELRLHWFNLHVASLTDALQEEQRFFTRVAASCRFPALKRCSLKGVYTTGPILLSFLRRLRLSSLEMEEVHLHAGAFRPVFKFLAAHMDCLERLLVEDLWEKELIFFDAPGDPPFPTSEAVVGPSALTRTGADARRLLQYRFGRGYVLGSPEAADWDRRKVLLYGPLR